MTPNKWRLSQSALGMYMDCKKKFLLSRKYFLKDEHSPIYFSFGREVHSLMESGIRLQGVPTHNVPEIDPNNSRRITPATSMKKVKESKAMQVAKRLKELELGLGITITERELIQDFEVEGAQFRRIIDGVGFDKDGPLLVDYKTASWAWDTVKTPKGYIAPKAQTIQSPAYLYNFDVGGMEWPNRIVYLIAPSKSKKTQSFYVEHDANREQFFRDTVNEVKMCPNFPASYGFGCKFCTMIDACFETEGWEEKYDSKGS